MPIAPRAQVPAALMTLVSVGVVASLMIPTAGVHAHGSGSQEYNRTVGPYEVRTFQNTVEVLEVARRGAPIISHVEYSLWLSRADTGEPIYDATVIVAATSPQSSIDSMLAVPIGNLYGVSFPMGESASWIVDVVIDGPSGSEGFRQAFNLGQGTELNVE